MALNMLPEDNEVPFKINRGTTDTLYSLDRANVLITNPITIAEIITKFEHDFFWTSSSINPFFVSLQNISNPINLEPVYYIVDAIIHNRTGAEEIYHWQLLNLTREEVLEEKENETIPSKTVGNIHMILSHEDFKEGDTLTFVIWSGKLGTEQSEPIFGEFGLKLMAMSYPDKIQEWTETKQIE